MVKKYLPPGDVQQIETALAYAKAAHEGQYRDSGEEFINHPVGVAIILAELEMDVTTIVAALLHDVLEDTDITLEQLTKKFGSKVALLVDGVTKLGRLAFQSKEEQQVQNLRKMFLAMANDIRVIIIKLADRLHNMRTLKHLPENRRMKIATETLEIYAPLAHRLGMWRIKWELEDLCLRHLEPKYYYELVDKVAQKRQEREVFIEELKKILHEELAKAGIKADIQGRPKHFYSIYQKMVKQGRDFNEIYDLIAIRVIVETVRECYEVLGIVHNLWKPIPGRVKDYISMPKSNMYQSLHTTVVASQGQTFEIQIRTKEMHQTAEYGVAAHWRYKEKDSSDEDFEKKISWLRHLIEWQKDMKDADEFMDTLRIDLFEDEVFVFTPKGDVKNLPAGSTPVDFAYSVHTDIGNRCIGAKVNGKIVPLDHKLKNGDIVEILTVKGEGAPSRDWLKFVKTSKARSKIRQWVKEEQKDESILKGRELIEKEAKKLGVDPSDILKEDKVFEIAKRFGFVEADDLFASVGYGKLSPQQVLTKLRPDAGEETEPVFELPSAKPDKGGGKGVKVKGVENLLIRFSKCCSPVPGDEIIGYITRGRGVSIHRADCPNVKFLEKEPDRKIDVEWDLSENTSYHVELEIEALDKHALLADIVMSATNAKTEITAVNARTLKNGMAIINLGVEINSVEHMNYIISRIRRVQGVLDVHRANPT